MSDVETLQQLVERRLQEMGRRHGRQEPLTLLEAYRTLPDEGDWVVYELVRRVLREGHRNIGDRAADTIATMLDVPVGDVLTAAGKRPRLGPFRLPTRADRLDEQERRVVLSVVDAILHAGERHAEAADEHTDDERPAQPLPRVVKATKSPARRTTGTGASRPLP